MLKLKIIFLTLLMAISVLPLSAVSFLNDGGRASFEYVVLGGTSGRPHTPLRFSAEVEEVNGVLQLSFIGNFSDVDIEITDANGSVVYQETNGSIYDSKVINITPADGYPYDVTITSSSLNITGVIYLE